MTANAAASAGDKIVRMRWPLYLPLIMTAVYGTPLNAETLNDKIVAATAGFPAVVSIYAKNLDSGAIYALRAEDRGRTASTIKLAILAAAFQAVAEGKVKWTDLSTLHDSDKVSGTGVLTEFSDGVKLPLSDLAHLMIGLSDNTATNM